MVRGIDSQNIASPTWIWNFIQIIRSESNVGGWWIEKEEKEKEMIVELWIYSLYIYIVNHKIRRWLPLPCSLFLNRAN